MSADTRKELYETMTSDAYARLIMPDGEQEGFILGMSKTLLLLQAIHEWQDVGAMVVPIDTIEACEISEFHDQQISILDFNSVKRTKRYSGIKIGSFAELFQNLKHKNKFVVISFEDDINVGLIETVTKESVILKGIDPGGSWIDEPLDCPFEEITLVQFDDSYSRTLQRYVERAATIN